MLVKTEKEASNYLQSTIKLFWNF